MKVQSEIYRGFKTLAKASHWLGQASRGDKNDIDDLKNASIALQDARQELDQIWKRIRSDTMSYGGRSMRGATNKIKIDEHVVRELTQE